MRKIRTWLVGLTVGFVVALALAVLLVFIAGRFDWSIPFLQTETVDRSQPVLLRSVQDVGQFHAAIGNFEVVVDHGENVRWVPGFIAGKRSLFVAGGTVNAYVDLSTLGEGDLTLSEDETSVEVVLPAAQLDRPNLDNDRTYLFSQDRGIINRLGDAISPQSQQELYRLATEKMGEAAEESELAERAEENTRAMLVGMFQALEIDATVTFADP